METPKSFFQNRHTIFPDNSTVFIRTLQPDQSAQPKEPENLNFVRKWWKEAVVYHIYPRSFCDTNGDGIGDLNGITSKLDYLKSLGVDVVWLGPVYESPNEDNGYDISDYCKIMKEFGTMDDWEVLLVEMHKRGIKLCMDLVLNHTSTQHEWFQKSRRSKENNPYRDYYFWRPPKDGKEPNNWLSIFGGPAWQFDELTGEYYMHLFSTGQPDLNWDNPTVRQELVEMIKFWLAKGVDAFRLDVVNMISKVEGLPDSANPDETGQYYFNGPRIMDYLREIKESAFDHYDIFTVGETPNVTSEQGAAYTHHADGVLSMIFHFEHMLLDSIPGKSKWHWRQWKLEELKSVMSRWQNDLYHGWQSLYLENHDQPRSVSRFGNDKEYHVESAKMLATWLHMMCGTPYVYQGQEIGMVNAHYSIDDYRDIETLYLYKEESGVMSPDQIMDAIHKQSRDNNRTPMQWSDGDNAGFTLPSSKPWIKINPSYKTINVQQALADPNSVLHHYRKLIMLRKDHPIIVYGTYTLIHEDHPQVYAYTRKLGTEQLLVIANFYGESTTLNLDEQKYLEPYSTREILISNYKDTADVPESLTVIQLRPYEAIVYWYQLIVPLPAHQRAN